MCVIDTPPRWIADIRMISGLSFRCDCKTHGEGCKLHVDINGYFEAAKAQCTKWVLAGTEPECTKDMHKELAIIAFDDLKSFIASEKHK